MGDGFRFGAVPTAAIRDQRVTHAQLRVLAELSTYADEDGWCFPHQQTMADHLGIVRETVNRHVARLVALGYVETQAQYRNDGGRRGSRYRVVMDTGDVRLTDTGDVTVSVTGDVRASVTARTPHENTPEEHPIGTPRAPFEDEFEALWVQYPRKIDKAKARRKYVALRRAGIEHARLLSAVAFYAAAKAGSDDRFVKHAATFLNDSWEEWEHGPPSNPKAPTQPNRFDRWAEG